MVPIIDITIQREGSIFLVRPETDLARQWISDHIPEDATWFAGAVVVEHRFIRDVVEGMIRDGLFLN